MPTRTLLSLFVAWASLCAQTLVNYPVQVRNGPLYSDAGPAGATFQSICAGVGAGTLAITKQWTGMATQTIGCNVQFFGGLIQPASGQTVAFSRAVSCADLATCFDTSLGGAGSIVLTAGSRATPYNFGAVGNGSTDDGAAIRSLSAAICPHGGHIHFPAATFEITTGGALQFPSTCSNVEVSGDTGATIKVAPGTVDTVYNSFPNYGLDSIIRCIDCMNIDVHDLTLDGNLPNRTAHVGGESFNSDVLVAGATNFTVRNAVLTNGMTDDASVVTDGNGTVNTNVWISGSQILNARRNNVSGVGQAGLYITSNAFSGAGLNQGTNPKSNIDIEPEAAAKSINVHIEGNTFSRAQGTFGVNVAGYGTNGCTVANNQSSGDAGTGFNFDSVDTTHLNTNCVFTGNTVANEGAYGLRVNLQSLDIISGSTFRGNIVGISLFSPQALNITGNLFDSNAYQAISDGGAPYGFVSLNIEGNIFKDNFSSAGVSAGANGAAYYGTPNTSASILTFSANQIYGSGSPSAISPAGLVLTSTTCQCYGRGNSGTNLNATTNGGSLSLTPGVESEKVPVTLVNAAPGSAIASAASITITGPYQHISGTTPIQNIIYPPAFAAAPSGAGAGCVILVPDGAWSTATGGNSGTQIFNGIQAIVDSNVTACYDAGQGGWYMSSQQVIQTDTGGNNAIATAAGTGPVLQDGLCVVVRLAHTLQAGANTFAYQGGTARAIKSSFNPANNIGTGYAATGQINLCYYGSTPVWEDMKQ